jgi:hypothetical protein
MFAFKEWLCGPLKVIDDKRYFKQSNVSRQSCNGNGDGGPSGEKGARLSRRKDTSVINSSTSDSRSVKQETISLLRDRRVDGERGTWGDRARMNRPYRTVIENDL